MSVPGFISMRDAPLDILGKPLIMLHWSGATERVTLETKEDAMQAITNGYMRYKMADEPKTVED